MGGYSFDHRFRPEQQLLRHRQADRLGGLEVEHEFDDGALFHQQFSGFGALDDLVDAIGGTVVAHTVVIDSSGVSTSAAGHAPGAVPRAGLELR